MYVCILYVRMHVRYVVYALHMCISTSVPVEAAER